MFNKAGFLVLLLSTIPLLGAAKLSDDTKEDNESTITEPILRGNVEYQIKHDRNGIEWISYKAPYVSALYNMRSKYCIASCNGIFCNEWAEVFYQCLKEHWQDQKKFEILPFTPREKEYLLAATQKAPLRQRSPGK